MPSLGSMDFPETTISDAAELAKKIAQSFRTNEFSKESLAAALGYKNAVSGAFNQRLADLRKYGIVEGRGDRLRATNLSQRLAAPAPGEYEHSIQEMLEAIPLFRALHEHFAGSLPGAGAASRCERLVARSRSPLPSTMPYLRRSASL
jgi:hypothetical protein